MKPEISDTVDVDKISKSLDTKWYHQEIYDDCLDEPETITLENVHLFNFFEYDSLRLRLCYVTEFPKEVQILIDSKEKHDTIRFRNITRVIYNPKLKIIIFESANRESYSELRVKYGELFDASINNPISNLKNSWLTFMGENLGLLEFIPD